MTARQIKKPKEFEMNQDIDKGNKKQNEEIPPRRVVLRGALAVGCGLLLPAALFGCGKKDESATGAAPADSTASGTDATPNAAAPGAPGKSSQASVQYQDQPKGDQKCDGCLHFIAESNTCKVVEGQISPNGWCILWIQKA
ncbi:MAG: hypothetical protein K0M46_00125 [Thiobacillus sp.]|nr:hypothetical protein [Thiobacillus sp.]